jgi:rhodanese-related sulfurtransferase/DNA-binding transcriptional ArsR family regulator
MTSSSSDEAPGSPVLKQGLFEQYARIATALADPAALKVIDVLEQAERGEARLAAETALQPQQLNEVLGRLETVGLVTRRPAADGNRWQLVDPDVGRALGQLRALARRCLPEVESLLAAYLGADPDRPRLSRSEVFSKLADDEVVVIDTRPREEFEAGHVPGAMSIPFDELESRIDEIPRDRTVVPYCRGDYCCWAPRAQTLLEENGISAVCMSGGLADWGESDLPVERSGAES